MLKLESKLLAGLAGAVLCSSSAFAEPTSGPVMIDQLRPYVGGNQVYVYTTQGPCAPNAQTNMYTIDLSTPSGKAAYAAALAAMMTGKHVLLEVIAGQCSLPYPGLQSVYSEPN
jgi:hypothetical protein